mmetsp:Transcript_25075/g.57949  ORF Transcript_25075/g.57949 Transcript_25075/m.57949 type:complete len:211 (+) Transcript_25075:550-1182(+)
MKELDWALWCCTWALSTAPDCEIRAGCTPLTAPRARRCKCRRGLPQQVSSSIDADWLGWRESAGIYQRDRGRPSSCPWWPCILRTGRSWCRDPARRSRCAQRSSCRCCRRGSRGASTGPGSRCLPWRCGCRQAHQSPSLPVCTGWSSFPGSSLERHTGRRCPSRLPLRYTAASIRPKAPCMWPGLDRAGAALERTSRTPIGGVPRDTRSA